MEILKRKIVNWTWENEDAQGSFLQWQGMPDNNETKEEVTRMEALLNLKPHLKVIDIGCGTGRHSIEFASRGYKVVGTDVAEGYLKTAMETAKERKLNIDFRLERGSEIKEENIFDFTLAYYHTLGFMEDKELHNHFQRIFKALKPGGKLLLRTAGPKVTPSMKEEHIRNWAEKDNIYILSEKYMENGYRIEKCITIDIDKNEITEFHEKQKAFALSEVINLLKNSGFKKINCYRTLQGDAATEEDFGIYVGEK